MPIILACVCSSAYAAVCDLFYNCMEFVFHVCAFGPRWLNVARPSSVWVRISGGLGPVAFGYETVSTLAFSSGSLYRTIQLPGCQVVWMSCFIRVPVCA